MDQSVTFRKQVYKKNSRDFDWTIFQIFVKHSNDLYRIFSVLSKQILTNFKLLMICNIIHAGRNCQQHFGIFYGQMRFVL